MKEQLCYAPGTKVIFRQKPEDEGQLCTVDTVSVIQGMVEYSLHEIGAWFSHSKLEFVEFPTKESLLLISSDEDEDDYEEEEQIDNEEGIEQFHPHFELREYELSILKEDEIIEELCHRDESGDR